MKHLLQVFVSFVSLTYLASTASVPKLRALTNHVVHEKRDVLPHGWTKHDRLSADTVIPLHIALEQSNLDKMEMYLMDVSDPVSPNYGKY